MKSSRKLVLFCAAVLLLGASCARRQAMYNQPKYTPWKESDFFADGRSQRPPVPGTVARGHADDDDLLYKGLENGKLSTRFPFPVTKAVLERGAGRYEIYCTPCHDRIGNGWGMIVQRGMYQPPSYHIERLRAAPVGHFFNVITNGMGNMNGYAAQLEAADRWAVIAYIRVLQLSQNATLEDLPLSERSKLEAP